ncbi:hypothetical protein L1987_01409 [Smallanthus sonchifolius]|uniref:Uncharacterized protein n=1 Tax=Smallanthus sonchifolius TaxID=185202 RepID=A0ACB9K547_9ASTR|nr:hypothetical protein L1987_01409 [Smallanthus sonchifolius]
MDEEELPKRFTDCIYFLASPLTCKKGTECVYRHSETARLNPRDCWYWLGGCCYNLECAFRHPPLEGFKEAYHESLNPSDGPTLPVDKTNVPCYFYSKGFCNKADRCSFLHEPADCNKTMVKNEAPCGKKLGVGNNTEATPVQIVNTHPDPPDTAQTEHTPTVMNHTPDFHQLASGSESVESEENVEREEYVQSEENVDESEEIVVENESDVYNDQSSDGCFDVLVEGELERLEYEENDVDFFSVNDEEHREVDFHYSEYNRLDKISGQSRVSIFNRLSFKKRNIHKKLIFNVQRGPDLRDHLKKSKVIDFDSRAWRNFRPRGSRGEVDFDHRGWLTKAVPVNRYRPPLKKPRFLSSDVSRLRKPAQQQKRESWMESAIFTGPKTLDQIREEKKRALENRDLGSNNRSGSNGVFQGPRPLSEILKNKRKLV